MQARSTLAGAGVAAAAALVAVCLSALPGCSEDGCTGPRDCPSGKTCVNRVCVLAMGGGGFRDGGPRPDATAVDAEPADGGVVLADGAVPGPDGGGALDGGAPDSTPIQRPDVGPGTADATTLGPKGVAWYGEVMAGAQEFTAFAEIHDRSNAVYEVAEQRFADDEGGECVVTKERLVAGAPTGYTAERLVFRAEVGGARRELVPDPGRPGRFVPPGALEPGFFAMPGTTFADVVSTGAPGSLGDLTIAMPTPRFFFIASSPPMGTSVNLQAGVTLMWASTPGDAVVEVYDVGREVLLRCYLVDDGTYRVPQAAISAWYAHAPIAPAFLELRYETTSDPSVRIPLEGGASVPATFRLTRGVRWPAF